MKTILQKLIKMKKNLEKLIKKNSGKIKKKSGIFLKS